MPGPSSELLPLDRVEPYLAGAIPDFRGPVTAEKTTTGQSNPTFVLTTPTGRYVLRRKPPGDLLPSAHAVEREYRVMKALRGHVPVPEMLHLCDDKSLIGNTFFVMSYVEGTTFNDPRCPGLAPDQRARLYANMNRTLASLHRVDVAAVGLSDFGKPGNYFARQLARWTQAYRASETETIPQMEELISWLAANEPPDDERVALVHGDWRLDNLLVGDDQEIVAVLDWELSTLGHPWADLASQLMQWALPPGEEGRGLAGVDRKALGLPSDEAYVDEYAENSGLTELPDLTFPIAFAFFRMGAIIQGVKKRALDGNASNPEKALRLGTFVPLFAETALARLKG